MTSNGTFKHYSFSELFNTSPILSELLKKVEQLTKLNRSVVNQLSPRLAHTCQVMSCQDGILKLSTSSPAWGHELRFAEAELLSKLRSSPEWRALKAVKTYVQPPQESFSHAYRAPFPKPTLTTTSAAYLKIAAENTTCSPLRTALLKLANRAQDVSLDALSTNNTH